MYTYMLDPSMVIQYYCLLDIEKGIKNQLYIIIIDIVHLKSKYLCIKIYYYVWLYKGIHRPLKSYVMQARVRTRIIAYYIIISLWKQT